jgi:hypothetical protein
MASKLAGHHYAGGKLADRQAIFGESHVAGRGGSWPAPRNRWHLIEGNGTG